MTFDREDCYIMTDFTRLFGIDYRTLDEAFLQLGIAPDFKHNKNRYWLQSRYEEIRDCLADAGYPVQDRRSPGSHIRIDASFFDFDPIPAYFRKYDNDEV